jgi:hypothetical protein
MQSRSINKIKAHQDCSMTNDNTDEGTFPSKKRDPEKSRFADRKGSQYQGCRFQIHHCFIHIGQPIQCSILRRLAVRQSGRIRDTWDQKFHERIEAITMRWKHGSICRRIGRSIPSIVRKRSIFLFIIRTTDGNTTPTPTQINTRKANHNQLLRLAVTPQIVALCTSKASATTSFCHSDWNRS